MISRVLGVGRDEKGFLVFLFRVTMKPTPENKKPVEEQEKTLENRDLITGHGFDFFRYLLLR